METILFYNIGELVTNHPLCSHPPKAKPKLSDLGIIQNAWILCEGGKIKEYGQGSPPSDFSSQSIDVRGKLILPGLVDSHTHPVFAGDRSNEFLMRLNGATYEEIANAGGGILSTVKSTRAATDKELSDLVKERLKTFLSYGVTSLEAKSGYGLSVDEEIRHLRILAAIKAKSSQTIKTTCLTLHAVAPPYTDEETYIKEVGMPVLDAVIKERLCDYVDGFIETGYFSAEKTKPYFQKAKDAGLGVRLHADEFSDSKAGYLAAEVEAKSADHLQFASGLSIQRMAEYSVLATLLPGTSLYTNIPFTNGRKFTDAGCPVVVASDFNPGSCNISNLPMLASLAGLHCGLNASEIIAGITYYAAFSLDIGSSKGALAPGYDADFLIHPSTTLAAWLADMGATKPDSVYIKAVAQQN